MNARDKVLLFRCRCAVPTVGILVLVVDKEQLRQGDNCGALPMNLVEALTQVALQAAEMFGPFLCQPFDDVGEHTAPTGRKLAGIAHKNKALYVLPVNGPKQGGCELEIEHRGFVENERSNLSALSTPALESQVLV
jgi:hypothetical protein